MEKPIKITEANLDRIGDAINVAEGRARERLAHKTDALRAVKAAERRLQGLPKRLWIGATVRWCNHVLPNSYRFHGQATHLYLERRASGWFLTSASREDAKIASYGSGPGTLEVTIQRSDDLLDAFLKAARLTVARPLDD